jgi:putative oxidoreductase
MRRLYSTFARGGPGVGLLLLRLAAGATAVARGVQGMESASAHIYFVVSLLVIADGLLLVAGLWTPISGSFIGVFGVWYAFSQPEHVWSGVLLASTGVSLALLGPGVWSVDARLFGWKRIEVRDYTKDS